MDQQTTTGVQWNAQQGNAEDAEYDAFLARIQARFMANTESGNRPVFVTDADGTGLDNGKLFAGWLDSFEASQRQFHNCSACRHFVRRFGSLAVIRDDGALVPAFWDESDAPEAYKPAVRAMAKAVRRAQVVSPFYARETVWGQPETGVWRHMALKPVPSQVWSSYLTASQKMAERVQDYRTVSTALADFSMSTLITAVGLLKTESLYRSEKVLGQAEWLLALHEAAESAKGKQARQNVVWLAVAKAPSGFCHPRSSMIGSLLEDIAAGLPFSDVAAKFAAKMSPVQYQRPQAPPSSGAIAQAEKLFAELGLAPALRRRFAKVEEIEVLWRPTVEQEKPAGDGLFSHLAPGKRGLPRTMSLPVQTITFEKFRRTVLPDAKSIEILVPARGSFAAYVTASDPDAPPILQWDSLEKRNPFSWYLYHPSSSASHWGLSSQWTKVTAISLSPPHWYSEAGYTDSAPINGVVTRSHHTHGVLFALEGARESDSKHLCLFPETLRSELHGVRAVIEAHSASRGIEGKEDGSACGLLLQGNGSLGGTVRVSMHGQQAHYLIERMD